jgi:phosphoglycerate dehydrogenase-like enzyme
VDRTFLPPGIPLCCCFGHEQAIGEYVMTALLLREVPLPAADRDLRAGKWTYWAGTPDASRREIAGSTIGLLGYGHIGKELAKRARAFGMHVHVANRSAVATGDLVDRTFNLGELAAFMGSADHIVVSLPLAEDTRGIVGAAALAAMRRGATIINVGRGPVIDEQALFDALASGRINAVIDTWYTYPTAASPTPHPSRLPFHTLPNVVMTPHMSGWTNGTIRRRQATMADNIGRLVRGEPLVNVVHRG